MTFDEFMTIPPCTTGKHSTTDTPPAIEKKTADENTPAPTPSMRADDAPARMPVSVPQNAPSPSPKPAVEESDDDEEGMEVPEGRVCRRKGCGVQYKGGERKDEKCVYHPGVPIFHEGSKGYSCCKRRVLEFDEFLKIEGCKTKNRHLFVGSGKKDKKDGEVLEDVRSDYYQTASTVISSFFLKKIQKENSTVEFTDKSVKLDLKTGDSPPKVFKKEIELFGPIDAEKSSFKIMGTKLELNLVKADGQAWPVLRANDPRTGEIIQTGRAGNLKA